MEQGRRKLGEWGETQAARYLVAQGCTIVAMNWRCPAGEVDLVVIDDGCLAFVEVRTRRGQACGSPEESITARKLARMAAVAATYVYEQKWAGGRRLDVVAIQVHGKDGPTIEWYRGVSL